MKRFLKDNGLSLVLLGCFLLCLVGQTIAGWKEYNSDQELHRSPTVTLVSYLGTGHYAEAVFENWESEFLQMAAYVLLTSFLFQRGSAESKDPDKPNPSDEDPENQKDKLDAPGPVKQGGLVLALYKHSLFIAFVVLFLFSSVGHLLGGFVEYRSEMEEYGRHGITLIQYFTSSRFWFESLQNWQSEFLAVASIVILSIWLRQQGSPESKPVAAAHSETGAG